MNAARDGAPRWLRISEAAELIGCVDNNIRHAVDRGSLRARRVVRRGRRSIRILLADAGAYAREREQQGAAMTQLHALLEGGASPREAAERTGLHYTTAHKHYRKLRPDLDAERERRRIEAAARRAAEARARRVEVLRALIDKLTGELAQLEAANNPV